MTKLRIRETGKDYERPKEKKDGEDYCLGPLGCWIPTTTKRTKRTTYRTTKRTTYPTTYPYTTLQPNTDPYNFGPGK